MKEQKNGTTKPRAFFIIAALLRDLERDMCHISFWARSTLLLDESIQAK
jgi:hypothetical protein